MNVIRIIALLRQLAGVVDAQTLRDLVAAVRAGDWYRVAEIVLTVIVGLPKVASAAPGQLATLPDDVAAELDRLEAEARAAGPAA